mgnify:CR=1 FL=1
MWNEQYQRMLRSFQRVQNYYDGLTGLEHYDGASVFPEFRDSVIHLFQDIFNLRDWLKNDQKISVSNSDIDSTCSGNSSKFPNLHIARDVANGSKHLRITRPSQSVDTRIAGVGHLEVSFGAGGEMKNTVLKHSIAIELGDSSLADALTVAGGCIAEWDEVLQNWGLKP